MLKIRVLTALALLPAVYGLVFWLNPAQFSIAIGLIMLAGGWEFRRLGALPPLAGIVLLALLAVCMVTIDQHWAAWTAQPQRLFGMACLAWLLLFLQLLTFRPGQPPDTPYRIRSFLNALGALTFCWLALDWLHLQAHGAWWIVLLLVVIWTADSGAYFCGRAFGRRRLAPHISPGKTLAGLAGGLVSAVVAAILLGRWLPGLDAPALPVALLGGLTALTSVGGDLLISMHKRRAGVKDSGRIFPGHGGVLDRIDSLLAGAPFFVLGKLLAHL